MSDIGWEIGQTITFMMMAIAIGYLLAVTRR